MVQHRLRVCVSFLFFCVVVFVLVVALGGSKRKAHFTHTRRDPVDKGRSSCAYTIERERERKRQTESAKNLN